MPIAVVLYLSDEGQMMVGEVEADDVDPAEFQAVASFEEAVQVAETLTLGDAQQEQSEQSFKTAFEGKPDPMIAEE